MFLADFWRQRAFRRLAKWLFGGVFVGLKVRRKQLGCHVGFKIGSEGPSCAQDGQRWPQERVRKGTTLIDKLQGGGGIILPDFAVARRPFLGSSWAHLGLSWALRDPSWGVPEGILRQILGLEGLILGCKVTKS